MGNDDELFELECHGYDLRSECCQAVLVSMPHLLDESMDVEAVEAFDDSRDLNAVCLGEFSCEMFVLETTAEFPPGDEDL